MTPVVERLGHAREHVRGVFEGWISLTTWAFIGGRLGMLGSMALSKREAGHAREQEF